jgi:ketosteroid isomerase-like protein
MNKLKEIEEIKQLKSRYFRYLDAKDWPGLAACMTDDVTFDYPAEQIHLSGNKDVIADFSKRHATTVTAHTGSVPSIELKDTYHAEGFWFMTDYIINVDEKKQLTVTQGFGRYFESYERENGVWRIKAILLERSFSVMPEVKNIVSK